MRLAEAQQTTDTPDSFLVVLSGRLRRFALSLLSQLLADDVLATYRGAADGLAPLDSNSKVPAANLPSYVDDVLEYANYAALPGTGVAGVLYITTSDGKSWRWTGSTYAEIAAAPDYASQAEAEAGTNSTKSMSPLRVKQAIDALTPAGGGSGISTPRVLYVETSGNNGTAVVGDPSKPYATAQAAFDAARALSGDYVLQIGVGSFSVTTTEVWPARISVSGRGFNASFLVIETDDDVTLASDKTVHVSIVATGTAGYIGSMGSTGNPGSNGPSIILHRVFGYVISQGGTGGAGGTGSGGDTMTPGGTGGGGGPGGNGGSLVLVDCSLSQARSIGGAGGAGGAGGNDGGAGAGGSGMDGTAGSAGSADLICCRIGDFEAGDYNIGSSAVAAVITGTLQSDYGANSTTPWTALP